MRALRPYHWNPLTSFQNELTRMFERNWPFDRGEDAFDFEWAPAVDVKEDDKSFTVRADLPGVDPKNVDVSLENGVLTIRGEREEERKEERKGFQRVERFGGSFFRRLSLPEAADADAVEASMDKGVLEISIPKSEKGEARHVKIKS